MATSTSTLHFLSAIFFLSLILVQANGQCYPLKNLKVFQTRTRAKIANKQVWKVTIFNDCICAQWNIKLACHGFHTVKKIDPAKVAVAGGACHINRKQPLYGFHSFNFTYAWDVKYSFHPLHSEIACS